MDTLLVAVWCAILPIATPSTPPFLLSAFTLETNGINSKLCDGIYPLSFDPSVSNIQTSNCGEYIFISNANLSSSN